MAPLGAEELLTSPEASRESCCPIFPLTKATAHSSTHETVLVMYENNKQRNARTVQDTQTVCWANCLLHTVTQ